MKRKHRLWIGCGVAGLIGACCISGGALLFYLEEGREIRLCMAIKDFYDANGRAPTSISELPPPYREWLATSNDGPYTLYCSESGNVPSCSLSWSGAEPGQTVGRNCGRLDAREATDWF